MTVQTKIKSDSDIINYFQELRFYDTYIEKKFQISDYCKKFVKKRKGI